jgi:hypothetical protein
MNRGLHILPVSSATVMRLGNIRAGHHLKFRLRECLPGGELGKQLRIFYRASSSVKISLIETPKRRAARC